MKSIDLHQGGGTREENDTALVSFLSDSDEKFDTFVDLMTHGFTLHESAMKSYDPSNWNTCIDNVSCSLQGSTLETTRNTSLPRSPMGNTLFSYIPVLTGIERNEATITLEKFQLSRSINLTALTLNLPFVNGQNYRGIDTSGCDSNTSVSHDPERCDGTFLNYSNPYDACGEKSCLLYDHTGVRRPDKQILLTAFIERRTTAERHIHKNLLTPYPEDPLEQTRSAFLYGAGSYITADFMKQGVNRGPVLTNTRGHLTLTFAKLSFRFENVSKLFDAVCDSSDRRCDGLVHVMRNNTDLEKSSVLVVGKSHVPDLPKSGSIPLPLVKLREPNVFHGNFSSIEYLDFTHLNTSHKKADTLGLERGNCSAHIDAYLNMIDANHFYMSDPRQPMYTAAILYLFQDAKVTEQLSSPEDQCTTIPANLRTHGKRNFDGDIEIFEVRYSVSVASAFSTGLGIVVMILYTIIILLLPHEALTASTHQSSAAHVAKMLVHPDILYPSSLHRCQLQLANGTIVETDEYIVESIMLTNIHTPHHAIVMN